MTPLNRLARSTVVAALLALGAPSVSELYAQTVVATVAVDKNPIDVAVNPATDRIYSANFQVPGTVSVIDGATNTVVASIPLPSPGSVDVNPTTNRIYVANVFHNTVSVIDGGTNGVIATIPVGDGPNGVVVNPTTDRVYVTNLFGGDVSVIDATTDTVVATVAVGDFPRFPDLNPLTNRVYVPNQDSDTVSVIDGTTNAVMATILVGDAPFFIAANPTTNRIYAGGAPSSVIDGTTNTVIGTLPVNAFGVAVNPATDRVYATTDVLVVIDAATNTIAATVAVGSLPHGPAANALTNRVYVPNAGSNTVSVIQDLVPPPPPPPPPPATPGKVTGGGSVEVPGGTASFGFNVQRKTTGGPVTGQVQYENHATGVRLHSEEITSLVIAGNAATIDGTCTADGSPCTFSVSVTDTGEPGASDAFTMSVNGSPPEGGLLRSGNIRIHD